MKSTGNSMRWDDLRNKLNWFLKFYRQYFATLKKTKPETHTKRSPVSKR